MSQGEFLAPAATRPSVRVRILKQQIAAAAQRRGCIVGPVAKLPTLSTMSLPSPSTQLPLSTRITQDRIALPSPLCSYRAMKPTSPLDIKRRKTSLAMSNASTAAESIRKPRRVSSKTLRESQSPAAACKTERMCGMGPMIDRIKNKVENMTFALDNVLPRVLLNTVKEWKHTVPAGPTRQTILNQYLRKLISKDWDKDEEELSEERMGAVVEGIKGRFHIRKSTDWPKSAAAFTIEDKQRSLSGVYQPSMKRQARSRAHVRVIVGLRPEVKRSLIISRKQA